MEVSLLVFMVHCHVLQEKEYYLVLQNFVYNLFPGEKVTKWMV